MAQSRAAFATRLAPARALRAAGSWQTPMLLSLVAAGVALIGWAGPAELTTTATTALVMVVAVIGFYIFVGNSGIFSFGHAAFMVIGAYAASLLASQPAQKRLLITGVPQFVASLHTGPVEATIIAGLLSAATAAVVSVPLMRLSGIAAALASFSLLGIVYTVAVHWDAVTNGPAGLVGIPQTTTLLSALAWSVVAIALAWQFQQLACCRRLRASREDELAARSVGIGVSGDRRYAFILSAFVMGVAGGLYAQSLGTVTPSTVYLDVTFLLVVMLVVGGVGTLSGAVVGSVLISAVSEVLSRIENGLSLGGLRITGPVGTREVGLAVVLLLGLILRPQGVCTKEIRWWHGT
jgi:branched-chain amino acid transport system permease protein